MAKDDKNDGRLTEQQIENIQNWIDSKKDGKITCPICKQTKWIVGGYILVPPTRGAKNNIQIGGKSFPIVPVICTNCGYTHMFNAVVLGVEQKIEPEKKDG